MPRCAAAVAGARPAACGWAGPIARCCRYLPSRSRRCWRASVRRRMSGSPASSARPPAAIASRRCCRPRPVRPKPIGSNPRRMAASAMSRSCSPTFAASPRFPRDGCPTTSCSCSTAISAPRARPSTPRADALDKFIGDGVMAILRPRQRARARLPPSTRWGAAHGAGPRRPQRGAVGRSRPAAAHRHRACMPDPPSWARWAMSAYRRSPRSAIRSTSQAGSRHSPRMFGAELVVSQDLLDRAGIDREVGVRHHVEIRGRHAHLNVRALAHTADLTRLSS